MVRTVRVRLELDRNDYKQGLRDAANDTRQFDGEVRTLGKDAERTGVELKQSATEAQKLGDDVKKSSRDVDALGASVKKTGDESAKTKEKVTGLGTETDKTRGQMVNLAGEIDKTKAALKALGEEFVRTGQVNIDQFRSLSGELSRLQKARDDLLKQRDVKRTGILGGLLGSTIKNSDIEALVAKQATEAGSVFGDGFLKGAGRVIIAGGPVLLPALAGLVAFAGAAIAGATLGATGLGAIATGIALQFNSTAVHNAATDLGSFVKQSLTTATEGFGPRFVAGISALRREAEPLWAELRTGLQSLDPYVANILVRLGQGLAMMGPGLQRALQAAGPVLGALAKNIPTLLNAIGIFFDQISKGGAGATMAIDAIVKIVSTLIVQLGFALRVASDFFEGMAIAGDKVTGVLAGIFNALAKIPGVGPLIQGVAAAFGSLHDYAHGVAVSFDEAGLSATGSTNAMKSGADAAAQSIYGTGNAVAVLNQKMSDLLGQALSVKQAELGMAQALTGVADSARQQGTSLDFATAKGQANASALLAGAQAAAQHRQALLAAGASADFATAAYNRDVDSLYKAAGAAGFNKGQVDNLIGTLRAVPRDTPANVTVTGVDAATEKVIGLSRAINSLHDRVVTTTLIQNTVTGETRVSINPGRAMNRYGGVYEHAAEGKLRDASISSPMAPARYAYAEPQTGGEAFIPKYGDVERSRSIWSYVGQNWLGMRPAAPASGQVTVVLASDPIPLTLDGRKVGELVIQDGMRGGPIRHYIRQVAKEP